MVEFGDPSTWNMKVSDFIEAEQAVEDLIKPFPGLSGPTIMPELTPDSEPVMPEFPGMEDPKLRQVELAEGGMPNALADDALQGIQTAKEKTIKNVSK